METWFWWLEVGGSLTTNESKFAGQREYNQDQLKASEIRIKESKDQVKAYCRSHFLAIA
jgi:hypothetical protein